MNVANNKTKMNAGNILKNLDEIKCGMFRVVNKLLVTSIPLIKKNIFTAMEPVYVNVKTD